MLSSRRLDDQPYEEIVSEAEGRLPWLCPVWTDHNAHDPGITILELMAWYKEAQQYQMDQLTPELQCKLLQLAGMTLREEQPARCGLEIPVQSSPRPVFSRLVSPQGIVFELLEAVPENRPRLEKVEIRRGDTRLDITALAAGGAAFQPFSFGGRGESTLALGFDRCPEGSLRLWMEVEQPEGVARNPTDGQTPPPRRLRWQGEGLGAVEPTGDETWSLSWSGYVSFPEPKGWQAGADGLWWLCLEQVDGGCEEQVRLRGISAGRYQAAQQESRVRRYLYRLEGQPGQEVLLSSGQAQNADLAVFLRTPQGWEQTGGYQWERTQQGRRLTVDGTGAVQDEAENLMVVCLDPLYRANLLFHTRGIPGETCYLALGEQTAISGKLELMCQTLCADGAVRPALWRCVEELSVCGPRDRVFTYDPVRETISFGDGLHGAIPVPGQGSVLVTQLILTLGRDGNIPAGAGLVFEGDRQPVENCPASGGRDREYLWEARSRLLRALSHSVKCVSAGDYAQRARETPGLRVAGAKALPCYDPRTPQLKRPALVTVAVLPGGEGPRPAADRRFLEAVDRQLNRYRAVCVRTQAVPVRYVSLQLSVQLTAARGTTEETVRRALEGLFAPVEARIGATVRRDDMMSALQKLPGVRRVARLELRGLDQEGYRTAAGDIRVPQDALACLDRVEIDLNRV